MEITYVIQKSRRRSMSIQVADDRKIIVKVPLGTPTFVAENFIREKKDWITNLFLYLCFLKLTIFILQIKCK